MSDRNWQPITLKDAPPPVGAYSPAIRAGDLVFVSGQVPTDPKTGEVIGDDVATQTKAVVAKLEAMLKEAGCTLADVVSVTAYLADIGDWDVFNATYKSLFQPPYPTRTTVGAQLHGVLVEISAVAYRR